MFESFNVRNFFLSPDPACSLYATGRTTGLVIDSGYELTTVTAISDGHILPQARQERFGGRDLSDEIVRLFNSQSHSVLQNTCHHLGTTREEGIAIYMKEEFCHVSPNLGGVVDSSSDEDKSYNLPDGSEIWFPAGLWQETPEILFKNGGFKDVRPSLTTLALAVLTGHDGNIHCVKTDVSLSSVQEKLLSNIILCGGNAQFRGMPERLESEINALLGHAHNGSSKPQVTGTRDTGCGTSLPWLGGSILTSLSTFESMWIPRESDATPGYEVDGIGPLLPYMDV